MSSRTITYEAAVEVSGKSIETIFRWARDGLIRRNLLPWKEGGGWGVIEDDVLAMANKRWTRRARPPDLT